MAAAFEVRNGVGLVTMVGPLTAGQVDAFRAEFNEWHKSSEAFRNVVMDCHGIDFMDSSGLGALIALLKRISERGGDLKLARLPKKVRMVFEITRAYKIFQICDTVEEALQACR
jgi:anti-sigma B factor antagonist